MNSWPRATDTFTRCDGTRTAQSAEQTVLLASCAITSAFVWTLSTIKGVRGAPVVRPFGRRGGKWGWLSYDNNAYRCMVCSGSARLGLFSRRRGSVGLGVSRAVTETKSKYFLGCMKYVRKNITIFN